MPPAEPELYDTTVPSQLADTENDEQLQGQAALQFHRKCSVTHTEDTGRSGQEQAQEADASEHQATQSGCIVLVNLSREDSEKLTRLERFYKWLPQDWVPYLLGSCRPVFMEPLVEAQGFVEIRREFMRQLTHSEIVTARKPIY